MPYATINGTSGDLDTFDQISTLVPDAPEGMLARIHGMNEQGLTVVAVWRSREDADRFFADHLGPALRKVVGDPVPPPHTFIALDDAELYTPPA